VVELIISFLSFLYFPRRIYARGAAINIDENDHAITHIPIVKAKALMTPVHRIYIAIITSSVVTTVPIDLLIVCHTLFSKISPNKVFLPPLSFMFSLILSKTMIVSLILYHIFVSTAIIKIVSIAMVLSIHIHIPYAPAGIITSNTILTTTTPANSAGEISFLIPANENNM
jgi:hypothetical protein